MMKEQRECLVFLVIFAAMLAGYAIVCKFLFQTVRGLPQ